MVSVAFFFVACSGPYVPELPPGDAPPITNEPPECNSLPFRKENTRFIAHRGLSSKHPDNSIEGFRAAGESDFFWGIETDIWWIGGEFYLAHDFPLRTVGLPRLQEFLAIAREFNKVAVIDIKPRLTLQAATRLTEITQEYDVMFITNIRANLQLLVQLGTSAQMQMLYPLPIGITYQFDLSFFHPWLTPEQIASARTHGREIGVWTISDRATAQRFVDMGVDYITTAHVFE